MDKNFPGTFSSDAEVNDFCNDLITSVRQMKEKKVCRTTVVIPIIETRNKTGLTQEKFAKMLGVSVKTLSAWEQGVRTPSGAARTLLKIADKISGNSKRGGFFMKVHNALIKKSWRDFLCRRLRTDR